MSESFSQETRTTKDINHGTNGDKHQQLIWETLNFTQSKEIVENACSQIHLSELKLPAEHRLAWSYLVRLNPVQEASKRSNNFRIIMFWWTPTYSTRRQRTCLPQQDGGILNIYISILERNRKVKTSITLAKLWMDGAKVKRDNEHRPS